MTKTKFTLKEAKRIIETHNLSEYTEEEQTQIIKKIYKSK